VEQVMLSKLTNSPKGVLVVAAMCVCSAYAFGQPNSPQPDSQADAIRREVKVAPGAEVRVGIYTSIRADCTAGPLPAIRLAVAPEHGAVTVRRATLKATNLKQCLATEVPSLVAFYRADSNSRSEDRFDLELSFSGGRKQVQHFHVSVSGAANSGQRI
jgi:hypothetical protein